MEGIISFSWVKVNVFYYHYDKNNIFVLSSYHGLPIVLCFLGKEALIISDSLTRDFPISMKYDLITIRGATTNKIYKYITEHRHCLQGYKILVLHVGTNHFSSKEEWSWYLRFVQNKISREEYNQAICSMNPPPANSRAVTFRDEYCRLLDLVKPEVSKVLVSAIIPRLWDHDRRDLVRRSYNRILEQLEDFENVYFIPSFKPFFRQDHFRQELFHNDGLHLNELGSKVLCTYICDRVCRAIRGELKKKNWKLT